MEKNITKENFEALFGNLEKFIKTETVVGEPIIVGEVTLIPIIGVTFGCATGGGDGQSDKGLAGSGVGGGGGARIMPNAIIVIKKDEVSVLELKGKNNLENLINMMPEIVSGVKLKKGNASDKDIEE